MWTPEARFKGQETLRGKFKTKKAYKEYMAELGAKGGKAYVAKGFSVTRKKAPYAQELHRRRPKEFEREESDTA